jgi:thioredoxin-related protein
VILLWVWARKPPRPAEGSIAWLFTLEEGLSESKRTGKPVMLLLSSEACGWCVRLRSEVLSEPSVVSLARGFVPVHVTVDRDPDRTASLFKDFRGVPDIRFLNPNGQQIGAISGYLPPREFEARMRLVLSRTAGSVE